LRKGLIFTGFLCLLVLYLSAPIVCFANEAADADADQKLLGDESDGSRAHPIHLIPLFVENEDGEKGEKITPEDDPLLPFSTRWTCGDCHTYGIISRGWHFNAVDPNVTPGRPGQPWILTHARTGTQIPLSYRPWPGTFRPEQVGLPPHEFTRYFGRHMPGGGQGEISSEDPDRIMREYITGKLEINCLSCHNADPAHNQGEYYPQTVRENFRWAAAATCGFASVSGSARDMSETYDPFMPEPLEDPKKVPPTVIYRENTFDHENNVSFDIVREVPNNRCYFCHSNMDIDKEDAEKWTSDEDIHLTAGLKCVDCHRNGIDHNTIRGYDEEAGVSENPLSATSSCKGCHLPEGEGVPEAGRLGAPIPTHPGIPTVHFDKLTCTACHSGPWPGRRTILTKTSRAHRLGTIGVNKSPEALPHIITPVFAKQGGIGADYIGELLLMETGKIAPHKMIWPAYWGVLEDDKVTPIDIETVMQTVGEVFAGMELPASGDWPDLKVEDHIVKALNELQEVVEGQPVYISGGKLYRLDIRRAAKLTIIEHHAAQPYLWPIAHNVRPAAQSLGVRYCTDCHATDASFFFGEVAVDSPIATQRDKVKKMVEFLKVRPFYTKAFAFSFVFRPWMKIICLGSSVVLAGVLLLYALKMLACIAKALTERD
jgi:hypothetical protein